MSDTYKNTTERILARLAKLKPSCRVRNRQEIQAAAEYYLDEHVLRCRRKSEMLTFGILLLLNKLS